MFRCENGVAVQHEGFANRFFLRELLFCKSQGFGTITRAAVSRNRFVKRKHTNCLRRSLLRVFQTLLVITGLNVVMGQLLDRAGKLLTVSLQAFRNMPVQPATPDWIELLVQNFADLVVRETER